MKELTLIDQLKKNMERYERLAQSTEQYKQSVYGGLEAEIEDLTGEVTNPIEKEKAEKKIKSLETLSELRKKRTEQHIKSNLTNILSTTDDDKLSFMASMYDNKDTKYKEFYKLMKEFKDAENCYKIQLTSMGQHIEGFSPSKEDIKKYEEKTKEIIKERLIKNGKLENAKEIEDVASVILTLSGENYKLKLIEGYLEKQKEKMIKEKDSLIKYIAEGVEKDNKYLEFGKLMYNLHSPKKE
jgi:hypothetical protein